MTTTTKKVERKIIVILIDHTRKALCLRSHWFAFQWQKGDRDTVAMILTERYTIVSKDK